MAPKFENVMNEIGFYVTLDIQYLQPLYLQNHSDIPV